MFAVSFSNKSANLPDTSAMFPLSKPWKTARFRYVGQQGKAAGSGFPQYAEQGDEMRHGRRVLGDRFHSCSFDLVLFVLRQRALHNKV